MRRLALFAGAVLVMNCSDQTTASTPPMLTPRRFPATTFFGGHVLDSMRLVMIATAADPQHDSILQFANAVPGSSWWRQVAATFGLTGTAVARTVTGPPVASGALADTQMTAYIRAIIDSTGLTPDGHTLYLMLLPPGTTDRCPDGGFHSNFNGTDAWGVVQRCGTSALPLRTLTVIASHEIAEAATDPEFTGWGLPCKSTLLSNGLITACNPFTAVDASDFPFQEVGDLCEGTQLLENGFVYQRIYSDSAAAAGGDPCIPHAATPYYNVWADSDWFATTRVSNGQSVPVGIALHAWSGAPVESWCVFPVISHFVGSQPTVTFTTGDSTTTCGAKARLVNNGAQVTFKVSFADGGTTGEWAIVTMESFPFVAVPLGSDLVHVWAVGAYVR